MELAVAFIPFYLGSTYFLAILVDEEVKTVLFQYQQTGTSTPIYGISIFLLERIKFSLGYCIQEKRPIHVWMMGGSSWRRGRRDDRAM